jgi:hypothetical protein
MRSCAYRRNDGLRPDTERDFLSFDERVQPDAYRGAIDWWGCFWSWSTTVRSVVLAVESTQWMFDHFGSQDHLSSNLGMNHFS